MDNIKKCINCIEDVYMSIYTSFKLGGKAKLLCFPKNIKELKFLVGYCEEKSIRFFIIGKGTNVVFRDGVYNGVVISLEKLTNYIVVENELIKVGGGVGLLVFNLWCRKNGYTNLEFSFGIPGSVGGAVYMNAGAFGDEIGNYVSKVQVLYKGSMKIIEKDKLSFSYRKSIFQEKDYIILNVWFNLKRGNNLEIEEKQKEFFLTRQLNQPIDFPSAGSVFKRDGEIIPAKIIDTLGLKGVTIGKVQVSKKHAGFFINLGGATATDLINLVNYVKKVVKVKENITLKEEIIFIGGD